ncbi:TPA: hypothetical protein ACN32D_004315 [Vibrio parahaemolyticus]|uniref:hypothetical protein n=1 Tax=Vibrio parahaemolyticus TaxID=670 RepID=UPI00038E6F77|nr:hypothetical protein [Vibrio parahaemolyticus]EJG0923768.1 hypothetical protein [Vibrio parahaemolyticus O1:K68]EJG0933434.1 hypothetical protein [Vibrio parahaemolyticus O1]EJG0947576.1 hypothetical protein [Vibrio parahaemolyticus O10]EQM50629.1 hypothetical protein D051_5643 [Vibrio parahaemolyticus VPCR-2010]KIT45227.1 glutamate dehydrogenase [Vibrio parahaemolyticus EN9701121]RFD41714.1 hypothetical protein H328_007010 [Vibrio parahaemolyticus 3355]
MNKIEAIKIDTGLTYQGDNEFEAMLNEIDALNKTEGSSSKEEGEVIFGDAEIADMIVASGVINNVIRTIKEDEQKLKEILDDV